MAEPLASSILAANPTLNADPRRYSHHDGTVNINRFVQQLRFFLPWRRIDGQFLEVRGHEPDDRGVLADFYDHAASSTTLLPIPTTAYTFAPPGDRPTQQFALKEITAQYDLRLLAQHLLSKDINQVPFQKQALAHAVCARLELGLVSGDSATSPAAFDGLFRLVERGMGQRLVAAPADGLSALDRGMTQIRAHNRRVSLLVMSQTAWLRVLGLQRRLGYGPRFKLNRRLRQRILHFNGVPICLTDHIPTVVQAGVRTTSVFILSFGRNGVFGLLSRKRPSIYFTRMTQANSPFQSYQAHLYCGLASATSDALVEVAGWNVQPENT